MPLAYEWLVRTHIVTYQPMHSHKKVEVRPIRSSYNSGRSVQHFSTSNQSSDLITREEVRNEQSEKTKATPT
nr:MAG TPA: hypothetical protein [Caudoviricetes sp.]